MKIQVNNKVNGISITMSNIKFNVPYTFFRNLGKRTASSSGVNCIVEKNGEYLIGKSFWEIINANVLIRVNINDKMYSDNVPKNQLKKHLIKMYNKIGDAKCNRCGQVLDLSEFGWTVRNRSNTYPVFQKSACKCLKCKSEMTTERYKKNKMESSNLNKDKKIFIINPGSTGKCDKQKKIKNKSKCKNNKDKLFDPGYFKYEELPNKIKINHDSVTPNKEKIKIDEILDSITGPLYTEPEISPIQLNTDNIKIKLMSEGINSVANLADSRIREYVSHVINADLPNEEKTDVLLLYFLLMAKLAE